MNNGLGRAVEATALAATDLGYIAALLANHPEYRGFPIACLQAWIIPALAHGQARVFFDEKGSAVGYLTWAYFADDVSDRWVNDPAVLLHLSEWNEGGDLWILDFFAVPGYARIILDEVRANMFLGEAAAFSIRRTRPGRMKATRWRR